MKFHITKVGKGEPLLLLHGFGFNMQCFENIVKILSKNYQCILVDLPGFGLTMYKSYNLEFLLNELHAILPAKLSILGWSLGGTIAIAYAKRYQNDVNKLILVATNPLFIAKENWPGMPINEFKNFINLINSNINKAMMSFIALQFSKDFIDRKVFLKLKKLSSNNYLTKQAAVNALNILSSQDLCDNYNDLKLPILSILGKDDQLVPIEIAKKLKALNGQHKKVYICDTSAHLPFITQDKLFIKLVTDFLE